MALDTPSTQVLDMLFDEDNGVLSKEFDIDGKSTVETLSFNDLDLLSGDLLDLLHQGEAVEDTFDDLSSKPCTQLTKTHSDHDYFAHRSPGQGSDSGVSVNSGELEDSFLPSIAASATADSADSLTGQTVFTSSPHQSESLSPFSDTNSDSNPLGLEDFDFSTCMDLSEMDTGEGVDGVDLETVGSISAFSGSKDTDVSIDFDFGKCSDLTTATSVSQQHVQTIKTSSGQQAIILVDANTRQPLQVHRLSRNSSDSDSLPFTMKDIVGDLSYSSESGKFPELRLTDEEKELLSKEGVSLPTNMPLTKEEERILKAVRRKIRNKISAKESRKRKQGYVDGLERRVKLCTQENQQLHKKVQNLEKQNTSLVVQLNKLKAMVSGKSKVPAQASTCVMVLLLSFALLVIPNISPFGSDNSNPLSSDAVVRGNSRSLLGRDEQQPAKVSMFSEPASDDSDPYGVSSKPALPWQEQNPALYTAKKDVPTVDTTFTDGDNKGKVKMSVDSAEVNDTENSEPVRGQEAPEAFQNNDLLFESELSKGHAADHEPPPAKKVRQAGDDDDL